MRLLGIRTEKSHSLYLIIYQVFKSTFSIENETLRLFPQKKLFHVRKKAFALTGRQACIHHYPGCCPGLRASALSGRAASKSFFLLGCFNRTARNNLVNSTFAVAKAKFIISCTFYFLL